MESNNTCAFMWTCKKCRMEQAEQVENGSPCLELICERCNRPSNVGDLTIVENLAWSEAIVRSRSTPYRKAPME